MSDPGWPWPPRVRWPDTDERPADLAAEQCAAGLDHMAAAEEQSSAEEWSRAAEAFWRVYWYCRAAAAPLYEVERRANEAAGLVQCGRSGCRRWMRPEELMAVPAGYAKTGDDEENRNVFFQCKVHGER